MKKVIKLTESDLITLIKQIIKEQEDNTDIWKMCLGFLYSEESSKDTPTSPDYLKYKGDVMRYCQAKRDNQPTPQLTPQSNTMLKMILKTLNDSPQKMFYKTEGENVRIK